MVGRGRPTAERPAGVRDPHRALTSGAEDRPSCQPRKRTARRTVPDAETRPGHQNARQRVGTLPGARHEEARFSLTSRMPCNELRGSCSGRSSFAAWPASGRPEPSWGQGEAFWRLSIGLEATHTLAEPLTGGADVGGLNSPCTEHLRGLVRRPGLSRLRLGWRLWRAGARHLHA